MVRRLPMDAGYLALADGLAAQIGSGRLRAGDRLPTQRRFAREQRIALSTAARVYEELKKRGLVVGETGRGTFVRAAGDDSFLALTQPKTSGVDLELNFPQTPAQAALLSQAIRETARPENVAASLAPAGPRGTAAARSAAAGLIARPGWSPVPDGVLFAGSGRQALAGTVAALARPGGRLGVESVTYPVVKAIAARLGVSLVPLPVDDLGVLPEAIAGAHRAAPLSAVYLQPALHNPLGLTMTAQRRGEVAGLLSDLGVVAIEDTIYGFLHDEPLLAAHGRDHVVVIDSLSKRLAPGLSVGMIASPPGLAERISAALRAGGWTAPGFALSVATRWLESDVVGTITRDKRRDAADRQAVVRRNLGSYEIASDRRSYHCWWRLPAGWRADLLVAQAARRGIAITPGSSFAVQPGHAPDAVRLALAAPPLPVLDAALRELAAIVELGPDDSPLE
jgi:DNA-binding transcriptional MocR family regulator